MADPEPRHPAYSTRQSSLLLILMIGCGFALYARRVEALCSKGKCQLLQPCVRSSDCAPGLFCSTCVADGDLVKKCHRYQATIPTSIRQDLPFNKYAWLTTHNAYAIAGSKSPLGGVILTFENQEDTVTSQLNNGVRGLMLDMYDFLDDVWLCHSFGGVCYNFTAFEPAISTLREVEAFLTANPKEIVTIFIEDYVKSNKGLTKLFTNAGLMKYWFPVSRMPQNGQDWPTAADMIAKNYRLLVLTSNHSKEASEGIAYNWKYVNENQYGNGGMHAGQCPNRGESAPLNDRSRSLICENFFPDSPVVTEACHYNSAPLQRMLPVCYNTSGKRWANYLAVDFYKRSDGGGALAAVDRLNAGLICGCSDLQSCKLGLPFGECSSASSPDAGVGKPVAELKSNAGLVLHGIHHTLFGGLAVYIQALSVFHP